ncbi:MAG: hypothetical protein NZ853_06670 [Leptospiraceae bacterium]|nr:hypothetical protein [Leptospiraceae bacterium]MDW7975884.1 hypothetical protein [Leptospiraceae bacterium]
MFIEKLNIKIKRFLGTGYLRYQNNIYHYFNSTQKYGKEFILLQKFEYVNLFFLNYKQDEQIKFSFISFPYEKSFLELNNHHKIALENTSLYQKFLSEDNPYGLINELEQIHKQKEIYFYFCYFTIQSNLQENYFIDDIFQIGQFFSFGYPPLILIHKDSFHFPTRSGIPIGVAETQIKKQSIEMPINSKLYVHTPVFNEKINLRELHYNIHKNNLESLPKNMILLEYHLTDFEVL